MLQHSCLGLFNQGKPSPSQSVILISGQLSALFVEASQSNNTMASPYPIMSSRFSSLATCESFRLQSVTIVEISISQSFCFNNSAILRVPKRNISLHRFASFTPVTFTPSQVGRNKQGWWWIDGHQIISSYYFTRRLILFNLLKNVVKDAQNAVSILYIIHLVQKCALVTCFFLQLVCSVRR